MRIVKEEQYNKITQQTVTKVYIEIDGGLEFFGEASEPQKVFALIGEANAFIDEQAQKEGESAIPSLEGMDMNQQVDELSDMLAGICIEVGNGITYGMMTSEQKAQAKEFFFKKMKECRIIATDELIDAAEKENMLNLGSLLMQYKYYTNGEFREALEQLTEGRKVTIVKFSEFGFPVVINTVINSATVKPYAQYSESLHIVHKHKRKRNQYVNIILPKDKLLIYDGWIDIDVENLTYNLNKRDDLISVRQSKYGSFDNQFMRDAINCIKGNLIVKLNVD
ncbi:hypothetical protein EDM57_05075 [Brevibacillus gelatini]|uniref:Uncharacterized protein n=1 Tax=Brevibacillus gelatini TaxID=1655277 RepID=A0A3M8B9L5_9BACL|nr:hypothetical protein [Brevibacillus gelatini]RNB59515.1 hypothetical protein EDM57_05075 [Brevibacillus gelatini]